MTKTTNFEISKKLKMSADKQAKKIYEIFYKE